MSYKLSFVRNKLHYDKIARIPVYKGLHFKSPYSTWIPLINTERLNNIRYLEIGVSHGIHLFETAHAFPNAELHGVDPWTDYEEYPEYKNQQDNIWNIFKSNLEICPDKHRINIHRGFSDNIVPSFQDMSFDIIYVDGNHETDFVYRDGCMAYRKLKSKGYIIFDDADWDTVAVGIRKFIDRYSHNLKVLVVVNQDGVVCQFIVQKL